jgi:broad specificity phosphatase PhoE
VSELFLIRHGQASYGADDYDQLSGLGYQQARWLGEYFRERGIHPDRMVIGTQRRHRQTADAIAEGLRTRIEYETDAGWNECDFQYLLESFARAYPDQARYDKNQPKTFYRAMKAAMQAWSQQRIEGPPGESWQQFQQRVAAALRNIQAGARHRTVFAVSSSGAIATTLMQIMGFGADTVIELYLQSRNTGINHFFFNADTVRVSGFNYVPHLDLPERRGNISFI